MTPDSGDSLVSAATFGILECNALFPAGKLKKDTLPICVCFTRQHGALISRRIASDADVTLARHVPPIKKEPCGSCVSKR